MRHDARPWAWYAGRKDYAMKFNSANEVKAYLWDKLNLGNHAITFHVVDAGDDILYFRPGIVMTKDDFEDSDAMTDIGTVHDDEAWLEITSVESYMIGDGESDHADYSDIEVLEEVNEDSPEAMEAFLQECADVLATLSDFMVENPEHDEEADWN